MEKYSTHFRPRLPSDVVGNQVVLKTIAKLLSSTASNPKGGAEFIVVSGTSGCGKSALCNVALRELTVLDVAMHYTEHQQNMHNNQNVQMDPKHLIANFATSKTMDQFFCKASKAIFIDDVHVLAARDRYLLTTLVSFASNPLAARCKFVLCTNDECMYKLMDLVKATSATHVHVASLTYKHIFQHAVTVLGKHRVEVDDERLLQAAKASDGNWQDFVTNVDHWLENPHSSVAVARDMLLGMTAKSMVSRMLYKCATVEEALAMAEYDCGDLYILAYENWPSVIRHQMNKRANTRRSTTSSGGLPGDQVLRHILGIQDAFMRSLELDTAAGSFDVDYDARAISTSFRYGKLVRELAPMRKQSSVVTTDAITNALQRMCTGGGGRRHPSDLLAKRELHHDAGDRLWLVHADCLAAREPREKVIETFASVLDQ